MSVLDNLVLTDGTRLFKTAAFLRTGLGDDAFEMTACDSQRRTTDTTEMARFWISYLGCMVEEEPRVATAKFFAASLEYINTFVTDPAQKTEMYESLHSEMHSNSPDVTPRNFIRDYVPGEIQDHYREFLEEKHVGLNTFTKDTENIKNALRRLTYVSNEGVRVVAPEGKEGLVDVGEDNILVNDRLLRVGRG
jgi:37-kD nucleoid-associated bacterial protein